MVYSSPEKIAPYLVDHKVEIVFFSTASDIWSVGCIFLEFLLQISPHFTHLNILALDKDGNSLELKDPILSILLKLANILGRKFVEQSLNSIGIYKLELPSSLQPESLNLEEFLHEKVESRVCDNLLRLLALMLAPNPYHRASAAEILDQLLPIYEEISGQKDPSSRSKS